MLDLYVKIVNVLWQKPNRGAIVNAAVIDGDMPGEEIHRIRIPHSASSNDFIQPGQWWCLEGEEERFNGAPQIGVTEAAILRPSGEHIKDLLAGDRHLFPGIGTAYAEKLWDKLGSKLTDFLESKDEAELAQVMRGLKFPTPDILAEIMVTGWAELGVGEIISWLDNLPDNGKFGIRTGRKIYNCWGASGRKLIEQDFYILLSFYKDPQYERHEFAAWKKVDEIAQREFKIEKHDERRLHGAVIESIFKAYDNGSTIIDRATLFEKVKDRLGSKKLATEALSRSYNKNSFLHNDEWFQARGVFLMEKEVAERIAQLMRFKQKVLKTKEINKGIVEFEAKEGYKLGPEQRKAVHLCMNNILIVITGGAGTGKTSILKCVYHVSKMAGGENSQMAIAGRAARRMTEATGYPARTIAGFLNDTDKDYKSKDMTFVIDEASMVDLPTMFSILRKIPEGSRLIMVGDAEQLPPIGPGLVFHILAKQMVGIVPTVELIRVYRQEGSSGIPAVAAAIRGDQNKKPTLPELPEYSGLGKGVSVYPATGDQIADALKRVYADLCETDDGERDSKADVQILAIVNKDKLHGVIGINNAFQMKYAKDKKRVLGYSEKQKPWKAPAQFAEGEPVIWTHNDWERELFNGTLGVIEKAYDAPVNEKPDPGEHLSAKIKFDTNKNPQDVTIADLDSMKLAYAVTVHKSQGSQFRRVIIPIMEEPLLDKSLIYTAVTRGVEQVVLVGDICAAKKAVEDGAAADKRMVGLGHMLKLMIGKAA